MINSKYDIINISNKFILNNFSLNSLKKLVKGEWMYIINVSDEVFELIKEKIINKKIYKLMIDNINDCISKGSNVIISSPKCNIKLNVVDIEYEENKKTLSLAILNLEIKNKKILVDTNIIIARESWKGVDETVLKTFELMDKLNNIKFVSNYSIKELEKYNSKHDKNLLPDLLKKVKGSYKILDNQFDESIFF